MASNLPYTKAIIVCIIINYMRLLRFTNFFVCIHTAVSLFILSFSFTAEAQKVYITSYRFEADKIVFVTNYKSEADMLVYKTKYKTEAKPCSGIWYITRYKSEADWTVRFTKYKNEAGIKICFTKYLSEAGWR